MKRLALSALMLSIVAVWGWTFVVVKDAVAAYGVVPFLAIRFLIGAAALGLFAAGGRLIRCVLLFGRSSVARVLPENTASAKRWHTLEVGGLIGLVLAAAYLFQTFGVDNTTATNAGLITGLFIVFAPLANRILFGVRTGRVHWAAIAVSMLGLVLLTVYEAGNGHSKFGDVLILGCAVCFGLHVALLDRHAHRHDAGVLAFGQLGAATVVFFAIWAVLLVWRPADYSIAWPTRQVWFAFAVTGLIATAAGFLVQTYVQQRLSAVETAVIIVTEPLFAALFGYWLAGDRLSAAQWFGALLMICAVIVAELYPLVRKANQA